MSGNAFKGDEKASELAAGVLAGDRRALARAITWIESTRDHDIDVADEILHHLLPHTGKSHRIGISGAPGVGKSTFIEALGVYLIEQGHKVAVLAIDPSSPTSKGSILGDKTRMEKLSVHAHAFVRPSPSSGELGGIAPHTQEAMLLCEAAGYDVVLVETVGVGQSEVAVADMVDTFVLLLSPGGGDEMQGIKRGVLELVDVLVVNKADGARIQEAQATQNEYARAASLFLRKEQGWSVPVLTASAQEKRGVAEVWSSLTTHRAFLEQNERLSLKREEQAAHAFELAVEQELWRQIRRDVRISRALEAGAEEVRAHRKTARAAARAVLLRMN